MMNEGFQPKSRQQKPRKKDKKEDLSWKQETLHSMFQCRLKKWLISRSPPKGWFKDGTEELNTAAQKKNPEPKSNRGLGLYDTQQDNKCRLCKDGPKMNQRITV